MQAPHLVDFSSYEAALTQTLGPVVGGSALSRALGFRTQAAFRKAKQRGRLPIATFEVEGRRGRFAATSDIAAWLWSKRSVSTMESMTKEMAPGNH
jgi:hypothetical protein